MFKHTVTYTNFNGQRKTQELYFHLSAPEMTKMQFDPKFKSQGGLAEWITKSLKSEDAHKIIAFLEMMIHKSYGRRTDDGELFIKKAEYLDEFVNSPAYEEFFLWLVTNPKNAEQFWHGIISEKAMQRVEEVQAQVGVKNVEEMSIEEMRAIIEAQMKKKSEPDKNASS